MRTEAQDTAPQIALTNCSKEGEGQYLCDFGGEIFLERESSNEGICMFTYLT